MNIKEHFPKQELCLSMSYETYFVEEAFLFTVILTFKNVQQLHQGTDDAIRQYQCPHEWKRQEAGDSPLHDLFANGSGASEAQFTDVRMICQPLANHAP